MIGLTWQEHRALNRLLAGTADAPKAQQMRRYLQHGTITTYRHCADVTRMCFWLNRRFHLGADESTLVRGAFLHDLYLYDWHEKDGDHKWHGFHHADRALKNADTFPAKRQGAADDLLPYVAPESDPAAPEQGGDHSLPVR